MQLLSTVGYFLLALALLVAMHEYGHYWVARKMGVRVLRFSLGFGPVLWRRQGESTEFVLAVIPLGGYVKMLDEREGDVPRGQERFAFNRKSVGARAAVVAAGPLANLLLAFMAYWFVLVLGVSGPPPIIGEVESQSIASRAGLRPGDLIVEVNARSVSTWDGVLRRSLNAVLDGGKVEFELRPNQSNYLKTSILDFSGLSVDELGEQSFLEILGVSQKRFPLPPHIKKVTEGQSAARSGLQTGDLVVAANGATIDNWMEWVQVVRANPGRSLLVEVVREGQRVSLSVVPDVVVQDGKEIGRIGAEVLVPEGYPPRAVERLDVFEAMPAALLRTAETSATTVKFLWKMLTGNASLSNLSGPISIAQYAGASARMGLARFVEFLALVSVSLAVLNLLPIPLLDGGHLLFYLIEFARRRPLSESAQALSQQIGLSLLLGLMGIALFNDFARLL
jgi:regulator of sigma E protease